ncbi:transposase family protein, partial [Tsukamurella pseudospumae]
MSEPTSLLLGLEGLQVTSVSALPDRTRLVEVITCDPDAAACPSCGVVSTFVKDHSVTYPRDVRYGDDPIRLRWWKTRYRCRNDECDRATFTDRIREVP